VQQISTPFGTFPATPPSSSTSDEQSHAFVTAVSHFAFISYINILGYIPIYFKSSSFRIHESCPGK